MTSFIILKDSLIPLVEELCLKASIFLAILPPLYFGAIPEYTSNILLGLFLTPLYISDGAAKLTLPVRLTLPDLSIVSTNVEHTCS